MADKVTTELLRLAGENPELPIVPMVDRDVIDEDGRQFFMSEFSRAEIDEYVISRYGEVLFKSDDDVFDTLESYYGSADFEELPEDLDGCRPYYDKLPWIKAIVVYIRPLCEGESEVEENG